MPQPNAAANRRPSKFSPRRLLWLLPALLLAAVPLVVLAQANPPHFFAGTVTIDGGTAPEGTRIAAMIGGQEVTSTTVANSRYTLKVPGATGQIIAFTVGEWYAEESAAFVQGQRTLLNLTGVYGRSTSPAPTPTPTPRTMPTPRNCAGQPPPPHFFIGTASLNGRPAANGTVIAALIDGQPVVTAAATNGSYSLRVEQCNTALNGIARQFYRRRGRHRADRRLESGRTHPPEPCGLRPPHAYARQLHFSISPAPLLHRNGHSERPARPQRHDDRRADWRAANGLRRSNRRFLFLAGAAMQHPA